VRSSRGVAGMILYSGAGSRAARQRIAMAERARQRGEIRLSIASGPQWVWIGRYGRDTGGDGDLLYYKRKRRRSDIIRSQMNLNALLNPATLIFLIPVLGILAGVVGMVIKHRERMAMIEQGMHPDLPKVEPGSPDAPRVQERR